MRFGLPEGSEVDYVDLIGHLGDAVRFDDLEFQVIEMEGVAVNVATPATLYRMKRDTVRPQDRADAALLLDRFPELGRKG